MARLGPYNVRPVEHIERLQMAFGYEIDGGRISLRSQSPR
jgi:hypothetical protein